MKYFIWLLLGAYTVFGIAMTYEANRWDHAILNMIQEKVIDTHYAERSKDDTSTYIKKLHEEIDTLQDPRIEWMLWQVLLQIQNKSLPQDPVLKTVEVSPNDVGTLRVRSWPSYEDDIIGSLNVWDIEDVFEEKSWFFRIRYDEGYAWIAVEYVARSSGDWESDALPSNDKGDSPEEEKIYEVLPTDTIIKTVEVSPNDVGSLRVRLGPSADSEVIGKIDVWGQIWVYDEVDGYFLVDFAGRDAWIAVNYTHLAGTQIPTHHLSKPKVAISNAWTSASKQKFLDTYRPLVDSKDKEILWLCTKYFDEVDEIAREYDFPVELIIAIWYREHTCKFFNPGNGWGNFQITSNYYAPGEITRAEFRSQVIDFIEFSRWKWEYYDLTQNFWPEPISLSYNEFDLTSIRKHSIYYNGIVGELETNKYTNTNFNGVGVGGTDGIVTYFLKVLEWELAR